MVPGWLPTSSQPAGSSRSPDRYVLGVTSPAAETLRWWADGELAVAGAVDRLSDDELAAPSALPDWSRAHVVAHLARNADALRNLLTWARTGVETPMYPSRQVRDAQIAETAARPAADLRADYVAACARLADAIEQLPDDAWTATVRNMPGKAIPATEVPWMRAKEVWVHGVDLAGDLAFADLPADFCSALVDDVLGTFAERGEAPDVTLVATDIDRASGSGATTVQGPITAVAAWLTRGDASGLAGAAPPPPRWL